MGTFHTFKLEITFEEELSGLEQNEVAEKISKALSYTFNNGDGISPDSGENFCTSIDIITETNQEINVEL